MLKILRKKSSILTVMFSVMLFLLLKYPEVHIYWSKVYKYKYDKSMIGIYSIDMHYACGDCTLYKVLGEVETSSDSCEFHDGINKRLKKTAESLSGMNVDLDNPDDAINYDGKVLYKDFYIDFDSSNVRNRFENEVRIKVGVNIITYAFYFCGYPQKNYLEENDTFIVKDFMIIKR